MNATAVALRQVGNFRASTDASVSVSSTSTGWHRSQRGSKSSAPASVPLSLFTARAPERAPRRADVARRWRSPGRAGLEPPRWRRSGAAARRPPSSMSHARSASAAAPNSPAFDLIECAARRKRSASPAAAARRNSSIMPGASVRNVSSNSAANSAPIVPCNPAGRCVDHDAGDVPDPPRAGMASSAAIRMDLAI